TLRFFAWPIDNNTKKVEASSSEQTNCSSTSASTINLPVISLSSGEVNVSTDKALHTCMYNANEGAALSLPQLPKVYDCYLSLHQWRELIASNDASMNCFENRDFEDLKVSLRKMPNSQATGEELGRRISCTWDMKAFDISSLWSLNAVIQLTQDLTRIHNVDEHASLVRRTSNC
ncbi:unnamed protein product, partial [Rotaria magnacalcarata]